MILKRGLLFKRWRESTSVPRTLEQPSGCLRFLKEVFKPPLIHGEAGQASLVLYFRNPRLWFM